MEPTFKFKAEIWLWSADSKTSWHFVTVPAKLSKQIKSFDVPRKGFGSMPVKVTIGKTSWTTSIFPNSKDSTYVLPLKAAVRKKENLKVDDKVEVTLSLQ